MSVKRSAPSSTIKEHPAKKRVVERNQSAASAPRKKQLARAPLNPPRAKSRRKAVTAAEDYDDDEGLNSSGVEDDNDEFPDLYDDGDVFEDEGAVDEENAMDMVAKSAPGGAKDPNASKESHKVQKEMLRQRQATKPHAELLAEAKKHWSLARQKTLPKAKREEHVAKLLEAVRGKVQDLVFKHDASRVVQTIVKCGGQKERDEVGNELAGRYKELARSKYAKFLVTKILRYCPNLRSSILAEFHGHVLRLLLHREASTIVADAYELYANASERDRLLSDLFGKEVALFQTPSTSSNKGKDASRGLKAVLEGVQPERRNRILTALKDNLITIFNNPDKGAIGHQIVHRALWEYLQEINTEDEASADKKRQDIFESCQELVAEMIHTKEGSRAVREFLACGTAKDRKQIIKVLKPHVERVCKDDAAQLVLFTALDVVDDTKMMAKSVVQETTQHASKFAFDSHKHGRRALLYLLVPRSSRHFPPATTALLAETDAACARTSKKDPDVRLREIRVAATEGPTGLLKLAEERMEEMVRDPGASLLLAEILLYSEGDRQAAISAIVSLLHKPYPTPVPSNGELMHIVDIAHGARLVKTLIQGGHYSRAASVIEIAPSWPARDFVRAFLLGSGPGSGSGDGKEGVAREDLARMAGGNGAFVVAELITRVVKDEEASEERVYLKAIFDEKTVKEIEAKQPKGLDVLSEQLRKL